MKKILIYLPFLLLSASCGNSGSKPGTEKKGNLVITGKLEGSSEEMVTLQDINSKQFVTLDSCKLDKDGNFTLITDIKEPGFYTINLSPQNFATLIVTPGDSVKVTGNAKELDRTFLVKGSEQSQWFWEVNSFSKSSGYEKQAINSKLDSLEQYFEYLLSKRKTQAYLDSLNKALEPQFNDLQNQMKDAMSRSEQFGKDFVDKHPKAIASIIALNLINPESSFDYYVKTRDNLKKEFPNSNNLKPFFSFVDQREQEMAMFPPGSDAPDFTVKTPEGKDISLSSFRGKIVLVDFWASWCGPCRKENPNVVMAYSKFHPKGLEIFSVSLDKEKDKWLDAIKADGLTWKHGSELKEWESDVVKKYSITGIPWNILVDKKGKVIAKNLRGPALEQKLEEVFSSTLAK